ncbi:MAG: PQQ-binding-like beta-propeller repeat protein [Pyrinomonadaceae bacterium]
MNFFSFRTILSRSINVSSLLLLFASVHVRARASEPVVWSSNTRAEILRGESRGVSVTDTGALTLAPKSTQLFNTEQAYIWSSAIDDAGNVYLGTGHDGRVYRVDARDAARCSRTQTSLM